MSKIVLLAINAKYVHSSLSVWLIKEAVARFSKIQHDVTVVETTINQNPDDIYNDVTLHKPDIIGISSYIWNAGILQQLLILIKKQLPDIVIVLGGPEASNNMDYWLNNNADYVLQGEGEYTFPAFLNSFHTQRQGDGSSVLPTGCDKTDEPSPCPVDPYTDEYLNTLNGRLSYIETSRGCPFDCSFCLSAGNKVKYFPLDYVKMQLQKLSRANTKTIKFVDRTFNCNKERAYTIFEYIIGLDTKCCFHFEVAADLFDEQTLLLLKTAPPGRIQFEIGIQSFFEPALDAIFRKTDIRRTEQSIKALLGYQNIHIHIDLIAGLPYEDISSFRHSFNRAFSLYAHNLQLGFLKVLHGSKLREQAGKFGIIFSSDPPYEIIGNRWLSARDIQKLKNVENALQHTYNRGRFLSALNYLLTATGKNAFDLFGFIGEAVPNHGIQLEEYIILLYECCKKLPGVDTDDFADCLIYDWLTMVKGKNTPSFLKNNSIKRNDIVKIAEKTLGRKIKREEYVVLNSETGIFVDSDIKDPVTGLYRVYICQ